MKMIGEISRHLYGALRAFHKRPDKVAWRYSVHVLPSAISPRPSTEAASVTALNPCGIASIIYCWMRPTTVCPGLYTMYSWSYRQKLRATFGMAPDPCTDCCLQFFCERCSLSQMYRELKNRGINPANGWVVNSQKMTSAPIPMQDMSR
ncbi:cell number regulator 9-like isoform X3 [Oryza brachyantha]|uniref:cell number regulator 9-like isoform X3 n=1 Tax=Oryza brachyantha TaxID=4533 RepID=UPI0007769CEE|nr:cell number regulator 9-like isoform X3 [Oryza brachyantha]